MKHLPIATVFIFVVIYIVSIKALECGIDKNSNQKELRKIAESCMNQNGNGNNNNSDREQKEYSDEEEGSNNESNEGSKGESNENSKEGSNIERSTEANRRVKSRYRRANYDSRRRGQRQEGGGTEDNNNMHNNNMSNHNNEDNQDNNNNNYNNMNKNATQNSTSDKDCTIRCVFTHLDMTDDNGFPEHRRVSQALLRNARGRELRDFIQDTTDECFQLMDQDEHGDPCDYSTILVNCLAERGKSNCADWPVGNLPFISQN